MRKLFFPVFFLLNLVTVVSKAQPGMEEIHALLENENYHAAHVKAQEMIKIDPEKGDAYFYVGEAYYLEEKYDSAFIWWTNGTEAGSKNAYCEIGLGKLLLDRKDEEGAKSKFVIAERLGKNKVAFGAAYIASWIGKSYLNCRFPNPENALIFATKARDYEPKNVRFLIEMGDAALAAGDAGKAMSSYESAFAIDKNNPETLMKQARIWMRTSMVEQAEKNLEECIKSFPNYAPAYKDLIEVYIRQGKYDKVLPKLQKYVDLAGNDLDARKRLVRYLCFQAKDYDNTILEATKILQDDPASYNMYRWLAWAYFEKEKYQESFDASELLFKNIKPDFKTIPSDFEYYAKAAAKLNKYDIAQTQYMKLMEVDSTRSRLDILTIIAAMYWDNKLYKEAIPAYEQKIAASSTPGVTDLRNLSYCYRTQKDFVNADTTLVKLLEISPKYAYAWYERAQIQDRQDTSATKLYLAKDHYMKFYEVSEAEGKLTDTYYKSPLVKAFRYLAEYTYNVVKDINGAIVWMEKAQMVDPNDQSIVTTINELKSAAAPGNK
jgi:tetratricopeptide (TPR) repeat protein